MAGAYRRHHTGAIGIAAIGRRDADGQLGIVVLTPLPLFTEDTAHVVDLERAV